MKTWFKIAFISVLVFAGAATASAGVSFQIGTDNFFLSVGDYDYLPYAYQGDPGYSPPRINFYEMMSQYGRWVRVKPFGRVWRPYASYGWRPFTYGHWIYTKYGPYWEGYEPWAWAGYHYGSWIFARRYGWVWVPGYDWHPGRVSWARGYGTIGWMPMPPDGYDYRQGYLRFSGRNNQFSYYDDDFGNDYGSGSYRYGGPYYNPRARDMYYNPSYASINTNLWVFIDGAHFGTDNYADYDLGPDYTRYAFDQRTVRISNRPMEMGVLERITRQPIQQVPVDVRELRTDKQNIRVVVPSGRASVERIRRQSPEVVRQVIAPAFAEEQRQFKGLNSKIQGPVSRIFKQENVPPRVETHSSDQVIDQAREVQKKREQKRIQNMETAKQRTEQLKKEGRIGEPGKDAGRIPMDSVDQHPTIGGERPQQNARPEGQRDQKQKLEQQELEQQKQIQSDQQQKLEQQKLERQKLEQQKLERQKLEQHELERQKQFQRDQQQKREQQELEQQKQIQSDQRQKLEQQKLERQKREQQELEQQKQIQSDQQQKLEQQKLEQQKLEQQKLERQKLEQQKIEQQKQIQRDQQKEREQQELEERRLERQKQIQSDQQPELEQ
ncbi:MAG: hypothetical protein OS130_02180 [Thermodesulfobacteriota bacterium]|nr:MAG: hypothetical protein OS130_02180 [Thermodesulfobacteriota bacterium]